jgi:hypothetical protein
MKVSEFRKLIREEVRKVLNERELYPYHIGKDVYTLNGKKIYITGWFKTKDDAIDELQDHKNSVNNAEPSWKSLNNSTFKNKILKQLEQYPDNTEVAFAKDDDPTTGSSSPFMLLTPEQVKQLKGSSSKTLGGKAPANTLLLVMDEDNVFSLEKLKGYSEKEGLDLDGPSIPAKDVANYPQSQGAASSPKWKAAVAKLGNKYSYYDVMSDGGENCVVAAVPKR